ncbi:type IVa pilus pseudopilin TppF [Aeromonas dhakensis]|uniref:type IVa pilus pseudopilin TppF n=1 Tax=Aeromonas dhakensis TaxID=196024 RepID=UPI003BA100EA
MMKRTSHGFTLIELVLVIIVLGILAVTALPRFINLKDDALKSTVAATAASFASAVQLAHAGWAVKAQDQALYNLGSMGQRNLDINRYGWPAGTDEDQGRKGIDEPYVAGQGDYISVSNQSDCRLLFQGLLDSSYTVASVDQDPAQQLNADYLSSELTANQIDEEGEPHSNCRYTLRDSIGRFPAYPDGLSFDYNSVTGAVTRNFQ